MELTLQLLINDQIIKVWSVAILLLMELTLQHQQKAASLSRTGKVAILLLMELTLQHYEHKKQNSYTSYCRNPSFNGTYSPTILAETLVGSKPVAILLLMELTLQPMEKPVFKEILAVAILLLMELTLQLLTHIT